MRTIGNSFVKEAVVAEIQSCFKSNRHVIHTVCLVPVRSLVRGEKRRNAPATGKKLCLLKAESILASPQPVHACEIIPTSRAV